MRRGAPFYEFGLAFITTCHYTCYVSDGYTVDAGLTVQPQHTVALAGASVTLQCTTDRAGSPAKIVWFHNPESSVEEIVTSSCQLNAAFPQYSVISSSAGQCDLVINNVSRAMAATYRCSDILALRDADLTVIGESFALTIGVV